MDNLTTKDSGIDWIGTVPISWNIYALHQLVGVVKNKNKDLSEDNLLSLSYGKIKRKDIIQAEEISYNKFIPSNSIYDEYGFTKNILDKLKKK